MTARYAGTTKDPDLSTGVETYLETWSVTGPGIERTGDGLFASPRYLEGLRGPSHR